MKVFIIDDHILFREGLASLLSSQVGFEVVGESSRNRFEVENLVDVQPDLVLLDPSYLNIFELEIINKITSYCPDATIVIITDQDSEDVLFNSFRAGAHGFLQKNTPINKIIATLQAVQRGEAAISLTDTTRILKEFHKISNQKQASSRSIDLLTKRERQILIQLGEGATNQDIANKNKISINTVKVHVHNILDKLNFRNRQEAATFVREHELSRSNLKNTNLGHDLAKKSG